MTNPQQLLTTWKGLKEKLIPLIKNQQIQLMTHQEFLNQQQKIIELERQAQEYDSQINAKRTRVELSEPKRQTSHSRNDEIDEIIVKEVKENESYHYLPLTPEQAQEVKSLKEKQAVLNQALQKEKSSLSALAEQLQEARQNQINLIEQQKNQVESKLFKVKDLILEKRWNSLQQLVKEGQI